MNKREARNPEMLSNIFYQTDRTRRAFEAIEEAIEYGWELNYCKATRMFGPPGTGKTQAVTYFEKTRCKEKDWKLLTIEVAPGSNPRKFGGNVLARLGDPSPDYGSEGEKLERAKDAVNKQGYDLLVIEEVHRLIDNKTDRVNHAVGDWITGFLNWAACPLLLVGEPSAERVLAGNAMLNQRTFPGCVMTPYDWGIEQDQDDFRKTLHAIDVNLGMPERSGLGKVDMAQRIYSFSGGLLRPAVDLIATARRRARKLGLEKLTHDVLAQAVDEYLAVRPPGQINPFRSNSGRKTDSVDGQQSKVSA